MTGINGMNELTLMADMTIMPDMTSLSEDIYPNPDSVIIYGESRKTELLEEISKFLFQEKLKMLEFREILSETLCGHQDRQNILER